MNERVRYIRQKNGLTQKDFGGRIGLKSNSVSDIENGKNSLTDLVIISICREFGISELWLREGIGDMKEKPANNNRFSWNKLMSAVAETEPEKLEIIAEFINKCFN